MTWQCLTQVQLPRNNSEEICRMNKTDNLKFWRIDYMKNSKDQFVELLQHYKKQKSDYEQKEKTHNEAYNVWWQEVEANGDWTEKVAALGKAYDKAASDLDAVREEYNSLAHEVLKVYMLL